MSEIMRRTICVDSNGYFFALLLAIVSLGFSGTRAGRGGRVCASNLARSGAAFCGHVLSTHRPLTRADRSGHCHHEARRFQCRAHGRPVVGFF